MPSILSKLAHTWTWFWSREDLGSPNIMTQTDAGYGTDTLRHLIFSREYLGNGGTEPVRPGRSLIRYLLSSEDLPQTKPEPGPEPDGIPSGPRVGSLRRYICQGESLPEASQPASGPAPSFLGWLFSRENLPRAGGAAPEPDSQPNPES